jgi:hypothetical protein
MPTTQIALRLDEEMLAHIDHVVKDRDIKRTAAAHWLLKLGAAAAYPALGAVHADSETNSESSTVSVSSELFLSVTKQIMERLDVLQGKIESVSESAALARHGSPTKTLDVVTKEDVDKAVQQQGLNPEEAETTPKAPRVKKKPAGKAERADKAIQDATKPARPPLPLARDIASREPSSYPLEVKSCAHKYRRPNGECIGCGDNSQKRLH